MATFQRSHKRSDDTFHPNNGPRKDQQEEKASIPSLHMCCEDAINRTKKLEEILREIDGKISDLQAKVREKREIDDLSVLRAKFESFKEEYQKNLAVLNDLHVSLIKNDSSTEGLAQKVKEIQEENTELKEKLSLAESRIATLEREMKTSKQENQQIKDENQQLQIRMTDIEEKSKILEKQVLLEDKDRALLQLGQVFTEIQIRMYRYVFPDDYNPVTSYNLYDLIDDVKKEGQHSEAQKRWEDLQERLKWNNSLGKGMRNICKKRNKEAAHRKVNEATLPQNVAILKEKNYIGNSPSVAEVERLIEIWRADWKENGDP